MKNLLLSLFLILYSISIQAQKPVLKVQTGHGSFVSAMAFTPEERHFISDVLTDK